MGHYYEDDDEDDDRRILQDGEVLRVSLQMMDSLQRSVAGLPALHQPGFASDATDLDTETMADAATLRQQIYGAYDEEASTAWMDSRVTERDPEGREVATLSRRRGKTTKRDPYGRVLATYEHEPDEREFEIAGPLADAESIRDAAYAEYDQEISNAW